MDVARHGMRRILVEAAAVVWLAVVAGAFLAPALQHGSAIGPYDLLGILGITAHASAHAHNVVGSDEIQEFIPWQALSWLQVHSGHLPLWDPFNLLGMPLAYNFEAAPFSLTVALGYAFPLALAHTATVYVRLVVAGSGAYVLSRMLRLGVPASIVGATIFELSGAFTIWIGTYEAGFYCFLGWVLAASVALLAGRRRAVPGVLLAVTMALALAAGEPQVDLLMVAFVAVFVAVVLVTRRWGAGGTWVGARPGRAVLDHLLALGAACGLVAPVVLPGIQLLVHSARSSGPFVSGLPPHDLTHLLFASYSGVPTNLASVIGPDNLYVSTVFVGAVGLILAFTGLAWVRQWRPEVLAFWVLVVVLGIALFAPPVAAAMRHLPGLKVFRLVLATTPLDFGFAMLAAFGVHALVGTERSRVGAGADGVAGEGGVGDGLDEVTRWADRLFVVATGFLAIALAVFEVRLGIGLGHLTPAQTSVRSASFLWPAIGVALCVVFLAARILRPRLGARGRKGMGWAAFRRCSTVAAGTAGIAVLLCAEVAFCITGGGWLLSSTSRPLAVTRAVAALKQAVGDKLVGIGACTENGFPDLGIMPDVNIVYGVHELIGYDPIIPTTYYSSYGALTGGSKAPLVPHVFCPAVTSVRIARFYGVSYVLEPPGVAGPRGTTRVAVVGGEGLYAVPGSGRATLVPLHRASRLGATSTGIPAGSVVPSTESLAGTWRVHVDARARSLLVLRVTAVPGWRATIDGKPLTLRTTHTVLLAAVVPAGRHVVVLRYWPPLLRAGLLIAAVSAAGLLAVLAWAGRSRWRARVPTADR